MLKEAWRHESRLLWLPLPVVFDLTALLLSARRQRRSLPG